MSQMIKKEKKLLSQVSWRRVFLFLCKCIDVINNCFFFFDLKIYDSNEKKKAAANNYNLFICVFPQGMPGDSTAASQ